MDAIPRALKVSVRARANGVSSGASSTKMADITLRWSQGGRLWRCCWSLADYWIVGHHGLLAGRVQAGRRTAAAERQCETRSAIICSMRPSRGVGHGYGSALNTIQSEDGYMESAICGSAREGDAAQAGPGWRYTVAVAIERQPRQPSLPRGWSEGAPHYRRKLLGPGSDGLSRTHGAR